MPILDQFGKPMPTRVATEMAALKRQVQRLRARYDAAQTTEDNRRHWSAADGLSANAANSAGVRQTCRNRARYETANNSYARGMVDTVANDVIGTGPRLQLQLDDSKAGNRLAGYFNRWAEEAGLADVLLTMRKSRCDAGEEFLLLTTNSDLESPVKLDLIEREADYCTTPDLMLSDRQPVDGIRFGDRGQRRIAYDMLRDHPGDTRGTMLMEYDSIPASQVIHYFRADRPGQERGIPQLLPGLPLFAQLRRFTLAVIAAAESAADHAGILYTDIPASGEADPVDPLDSIEFEKRMLTTVPAGWKLAQMEAEQPTTTYGEFVKAILNEIARCLQMPYNIAAANSSGYNYSSGRMDHQVYFRQLRIDQRHIERRVLNRILFAWLDEAIHIPGLIQDGLPPFIEWPFKWFWDGFGHVDPLKEAQAQDVKLKNHTTTLADEWAKEGRDWEEAITQRGIEAQRLEDEGLGPVAGTPGAMVPPSPPDPAEEEPPAD